MPCSISGMKAAHRVLKNAGAAPAWVEQGRNIRAGLRAARFRLEDAWLERRYSSAFVMTVAPKKASRSSDAAAAALAAKWAAAVDTFAQDIHELNKQIWTCKQRRAPSFCRFDIFCRV